MSRIHKADVLVLGAGPAASACAIHAASAGRDVVMVAPASVRLRPGETLHPGVEPIFDHLGIGEAVRGAGWLRHLGCRVGPAGCFAGYGKDAAGPWRGFQAPTAELDQLLLERVRAVGATLVPGVAKELLVADCGSIRRVDGVALEDAEIVAPVTVDATGPTRFAMKALGLSTHIDGPARCVYWGHTAHLPLELQQEPHFQQLPSGWLWRAPIHDSLCAWVWGPYGNAAYTSGTARSTLSEILDTSNPGRIRGASAASTLVRLPCTYAGLLLAGDAAFSVSPLAGKGVLRALLMGIAAGASAHQLLAIRASSNRIMASHAAWIAHWFAREAALVKALHAGMRGS